MFFGYFAICYLIFLFIRQQKEIRQDKKWQDADDFHNLMFLKLLELRDDCTMTEAKWRAWLPLFEYADRMYITSNCYNLKFNMLSDYVRKEIDDGKEYLFR